MDFLRGLNVPPVIVGLVRGAVEAAVLGGLGALIIYVTSADLGSWVWVAPVIVQGIRFLEGLADQIDPANIPKKSPISKEQRYHR